eukprot:TRINITY_DN110464_c0_g1_i1.p1 TRINITY_DN110464_c0_g1~~TRINITY_DN110464_c0_g1_i1.p1  ORF type:complete len:384 (-),score=74.93 TRINITY_DN110464_c0_g1_i1:23-1174(-)
MGSLLSAAATCPCLGRTVSEFQHGNVDAKQSRKSLQREQRRLKGRERRREQKQRSYWTRKAARKDLLNAMSDEERAAFLEQEKVKTDKLQRTLEHAFNAGCPKVVVNCSFTNGMDHKELSSLAKQLQLSYTALRDLASPMQLHFTSLHPGNACIDALTRRGYRKWLVHVHEEPVWELFDLERLVVLSPDAEEDLDEVLEDYIYVIGGIVDRQIRRNESKAQAEAKGAPILRRLPVKSFGPPGMYPVLNIDVVLTILHERFKRGRDSDWCQILLDCMPLRQHPSPTQAMLQKQEKDHGCPEAKDKTIADSSNESSSSEKLPASCTLGLRQGTEVEVAGYGRATIISLGVLPHGKNMGKYHVRYWDGKTYHVFPEQIATILQKEQ